MDLSKISTADLQALQAGDLSKISTAGLQLLHAQAGGDGGAAARATANDAAMRKLADPTADMGPIERGVAAYGGVVPNALRGLSQVIPLPDSVKSKLGMATQADVDEAKQRDNPLMQTTAGKVGSFLGNVALAIPAAFIPGVNGYAGAAVGGALTGALQPTASDEGPYAGAKNIALGAAAGPLGVAGARGVGAIYGAGKALVQPMYQSGREKIAGDVLNRFADDPSKIAGTTSAPTITGARPTLAEQTGDPGLARLQDSLRSLDPQIETAIGNRLSGNNAARVDTLNRLAGTDGARDFAVAERAGTAGPMYDEALSARADAGAMTPEQSRTLSTLMRSPAIKSAQRDAQAIAANKGTNVGPSNASGSVEGLHNMKLAMDDQIAAAKAAGNSNLAASIKAAQDKLVGFIEEVSPEYANARGTYAQMSKPINSMDVAGQVAKRGLSAGTDLSGNPTINRNALLRSMQDEPALIRQATGRTGVGNKLSDVMTPDDENLLRTVASESDRAGAVAAAGNGPGSATAQRMASQNLVNNLLGPLGAPGGVSEGWMRSLGDVLFKSPAGRLVNQLHAGWEPDIQKLLAQAVLDPSAAQRVLAAAQKASLKLPPNLAQRLALTASQSGASTLATTDAP